MAANRNAQTFADATFAGLAWRSGVSPGKRMRYEVRTRIQPQVADAAPKAAIQLSRLGFPAPFPRLEPGSAGDNVATLEATTTWRSLYASQDSPKVILSLSRTSSVFVAYLTTTTT